jgi:hypothetical protein
MATGKVASGALAVIIPPARAAETTAVISVAVAKSNVAATSARRSGVEVSVMPLPLQKTSRPS